MTKLMPPPENLFHALADPTRVAVIQALCREPATVSRLAAPHKMALPSFVQHLRVLEDCGWISTHKQGRVRTCKINPDALTRSAQWLLGQKAVWEKRLDQLDSLLYKLKDDKETQP